MLDREPAPAVRCRVEVEPGGGVVGGSHAGFRVATGPALLDVQDQCLPHLLKGRLIHHYVGGGVGTRRLRLDDRRALQLVGGLKTTLLLRQLPDSHVQIHVAAIGHPVWSDDGALARVEHVDGVVLHVEDLDGTVAIH